MRNCSSLLLPEDVMFLPERLRNCIISAILASGKGEHFVAWRKRRETLAKIQKGCKCDPSGVPILESAPLQECTGDPHSV